MWKNININVQNIETETEKSILINMPNNSKYQGYSFWHPSKLIRSGNHSYAISLGYNDSFTFKLKKFGKGKYNKFDVIDEKEISVEEFEIAFGVMNENIVAPKDETYLIVEEPTKIEKNIEIEESLKK